MRNFLHRLLICRISFILFFFSLTTSKSEKQDDNDKVKVSVYYESLCPDSVDFFHDQFEPNFRDFFDYLIYDFVPYGHATQKKDSSGKWHFTCQHGDQECQENRFQACAVRYLNKKPEVLASFISCYMQQENKKGRAKKCSKKNNVNLKTLDKCARNKTGDNLLAKMGNRTHDFTPKIEFIPTIVLEDIYDQDEQDEAITDFKKLICHTLDNAPEVCHN